MSIIIFIIVINTDNNIDKNNHIHYITRHPIENNVKIGISGIISLGGY